MDKDKFTALNFRLPKELHAKLVKLAAKENRSLNQQMVYMLQQQLDEQKEGKK